MNVETHLKEEPPITTEVKNLGTPLFVLDPVVHPTKIKVGRRMNAENIAIK